ncbi:MAG: helix-turn-helix transcriptional regulator, partial [Deltaproteobacteria bacterium]|nr:helix-turn-helix transcriptional regulator [Deltaproteobacteria bacterium]
MNFGPRLKAWRLSKNLTQESLARKAGIPRPNLADIEAGRRDCTLKTLGRLAYALEMKPGELLDHSPHDETLLDRHQIDEIARSLVHPGPALPPELQLIQKDLLPVVRPILISAGVPLDSETPTQ